MISDIKKTFRNYFAEDKNLTLENRMYISALLVGMLISIISAIIVQIISPSNVALISNIILFFSLVIIYWFAKFRKITEPFKIPIIIISFFGISIIWVFDGGMDGPDMMIAFVILMLALIIIHDKAKKYIITLFVSLVITIYLIQLLRPDIIVKIPSRTDKWFDSFLTAIYCSVFIYLIIRFVHKHYTVEKLKAEANEIKFRNYIDSAPDGVFVVDSRGICLDVNPAACKLLGKTKEELISKSILHIVNEKDNSRFLQILSGIRSAGKYSKEITFNNKDGLTVIGLLEVVKISDNQYLSFIKNITEWKKAEKEIRMLANAMMSINDCVSITDKENNILFVNEAFLRTYGYSEKELIGENISLVTSPNNKPGIKDEVLKGTLMGGWNGELVNLRKDGSEFPIHLSTSIIFNENNSPIALIGVSSDITSRKKAEDEMIVLNKRLRELIADKDRFMAILAHDLKSPFNTLLGFSELLVRDLHSFDKETIENFAKIINESAQNTYKLLEDLLMWAQTKSGKLHFKPQYINFSTVCKDVIEFLSLTAKEKNITINQLASQELSVFADPEMLKTIMRNLISNAIKFTNSGGRIDIHGERGIDNIIIAVSDNGIGIESHKQKELFDSSQFHSIEGTRGEKGTGLGLILCKEFVEKHGGSIWVESEFSKGSTFKFTIPISN